jgi:diguanylate cyclase (GGDEF)-like protein/PAS domain S-box-containing protein
VQDVPFTNQNSPTTARARLEEILGPLVRFARTVLKAEAVTVALRHDGEETLLIGDRQGIRQTGGSVSLGVVGPGRQVLSGGSGILQAAEAEAFLGFAPAEYLGAPFPAKRGVSPGALATWNRARGRWTAADAALLREISTLVLQQLELSSSVAAGRPAAGHEQPHREIFERCAEPIFVTTLDGEITEANAAAGILLGLSVGEERRRAADAFVEAADWRRLLQRAAAVGSVFRVESQLRRADGRTVACSLAVTPWANEEGEIVGQMSVVHDVSGSKELEERLRRAALHDPLTKLPNRTLFVDRLEHALTRVRRWPSYGFAVVFLDLDRFKAINDTLGHHRGDELLIATARRLESSLRSVDTVARIGGDEFAILLDEVPTAHVARKLVERIITALAPPLRLEGHEVYVRASVGVTMGTARYATPAEVLHDADAAMYLSRRQPSGSYQIFDESMRREWALQLQMETELRQAIEEGQLRLHYQPVVCLESGEVAGLEAVLRWQHPARGLLDPDQFRKVAEETGLALPLARWAVTEICRQVKAWDERGGATLGRRTVSLRLSAYQARPELLSTLKTAAGETGVDPRALRFAIEERALAANPTLVAQLARDLRTLGAAVEIADFGIAASSLDLLHALPIDALNIHPSMVSSLTDSGSRPRTARTIIAIAHTMGLRAVASGVENGEQAALLGQAECDLAMGPFLSSPLDPGGVPAFLQSAAVGMARW